MRSPWQLAAISLPKLPPAIAAQDVLHRPSNGKTKPPSKMVSKMIQQPIKKAVVSKRMTNTAPCLPLLPTTPVPLTCSVPISSTRVISSREAGKELELPVPVATKRHIVKTSVVNTRSTVDAETHHAAVDVGSSAKCPANVDKRAPKHSTDAQQLAPPQAQSSKFPGGMGEERHTAYVVDKINEANTMLRVPESPVVLTPPTLLSPPIPPLPHQLANGHAMNTTSQLCHHNDRNEE
ncbi:hypothetical protein AX14_003071 [Amanita brunnescens Koide BX004]|nr:hypothetical protein AX14_003071 [Amanita brunnescens Koide BX004]